MLRILLNVPIAYLLAAGYIIIIILAFFTPARFVPVAFDSGRTESVILSWAS